MTHFFCPCCKCCSVICSRWQESIYKARREGRRLKIESPNRRTQMAIYLYTLVRIGTHQYTSVHIRTHQYISIHFSTHQYTLVHFSALQCTSVHISTHQYTSVHFSTLHNTLVHISSIGDGPSMVVATHSTKHFKKYTTQFRV